MTDTIGAPAALQFGPDKIWDIHGTLAKFFALAIDDIPNWTENEWTPDRIVGLESTADCVPQLLTGLARACEERGIDSSAFNDVGVQYIKLWKAHPNVREALVHLRDYLGDDYLMSYYAPTIHRLLRCAELEQQQGKATKLQDEPTGAVEALLLGAMTATPTRGAVLAKKAGVKFNSHAKNALSGLVKQKRCKLKKGRGGGYFVESTPDGKVRTGQD